MGIYKIGTSEGEYALSGKRHEFEDTEIIRVEKEKESYKVCSGAMRVEWEKGKPETRREHERGASICVNIPQEIMKKIAKELLEEEAKASKSLSNEPELPK